MKPYYVCTYCDKKLYDGDEVYKNEYNELYCSIECLNHCEKITVSNITCADSHCYWEDEDDDYIEPPTNKQLNLIKAICDYMPWIEMPEVKTKSDAFHWLQIHIPMYKEQKSDDIRQKIIGGWYDQD